MSAEAELADLLREPPGPDPRGVPLRLRGPGLPSDGRVLAYGTGHGPPLTPARSIR